MALSWGKRRKLLYSVVGGVFGFALLALLYNAFFNATPGCFDRSQNGDERGVDCGGSCKLLCAGDARALQIRWSRAFLLAPGEYTAAAFVQNPNAGVGARRVPYTFQLFDANNSLIVERTGVVDLPPVQSVVVVEPAIRTGMRQAARALFAFGAEPRFERAQAWAGLRLSGQLLSVGGARLSATLHNDSLEDVRKVTLTAVLYDSGGVARAASKALVERVERKSSEPVVFTWEGGVPDIVRAEIGVLPPF